MLSSRTLDYRFWFTLALSIVFGLILLQLLPVFVAKPLFLLAFPFAGIFFMVLVLKPKLTLGFLLLSRPLLDNLLNLTRTDVGGESIGIGAILNLAIIILAIFLAFHYSDFPRENRTVVCWIIFLFFMFIASLYSPFQGRAIRLFLNYVSYFAMFVIPFLIIKNKGDFLFWLKILAWSFVLPVLYSNFDLIRGGHYYSDAGMRINGTFSHPNILAFYLVLGITFYFYILTSKYWKLSLRSVWAIRIFILNMLLLLVATKTRNAWIACFGGFFIYGLLKDRKFLLLLLLLLPLSLLVPQVQERVFTVVQGKEAGGYKGVNSLQWRLDVWRNSLPEIAKRPSHGYGLTSFMSASENFTRDRVSVGAHNTYVELLFETGVLGLLSFLALFLSPLNIFFRNMMNAALERQAKLYAVLVGYTLSYLIICFADNLSYYLVLNWYVWFFIGLMLMSERFSYD